MKANRLERDAEHAKKWKTKKRKAHRCAKFRTPEWILHWGRVIPGKQHISGAPINYLMASSLKLKHETSIIW